MVVVALLSGCATGLGGGGSAGAARNWAIPSKPYPGQFRPDAKGQCPSKFYIAINGGCWFKIEAKPQECVQEEDPNYYPLLHLHQGECYVPAIRPPGPATSRRCGEGIQPPDAEAAAL